MCPVCAGVGSYFYHPNAVNPKKYPIKILNVHRWHNQYGDRPAVDFYVLDHDGMPYGYVDEKGRHPVVFRALRYATGSMDTAIYGPVENHRNTERDTWVLLFNAGTRAEHTAGSLAYADSLRDLLNFAIPLIETRQQPFVARLVPHPQYIRELELGFPDTAPLFAPIVAGNYTLSIQLTRTGSFPTGFTTSDLSVFAAWEVSTNVNYDDLRRLGVSEDDLSFMRRYCWEGDDVDPWRNVPSALLQRIIDAMEREDGQGPSLEPEPGAKTPTRLLVVNPGRHHRRDMVDGTNTMIQAARAHVAFNESVREFTVMMERLENEGPDETRRPGAPPAPPTPQGIFEQVQARRNTRSRRWTVMPRQPPRGRR